MEALAALSPDDKAVLRSSWKAIVPQLKSIACALFEMIFAQSPDTKLLFPFMKIPHHGKSREMEFHGLRFLQVLENVINSLDTPATLDPLCDNLGRLHGRLSESRGFQTHHWSVFIECTLFHFRRVLSQAKEYSSVEPLDRAVMCWRVILRSLIERMKEGFDTDLKNRRINREGVAATSVDASTEEHRMVDTLFPGPRSMGRRHSCHEPNGAALAPSPSLSADRRPSHGILQPLKAFAHRKLSHFVDRH